MMIGIMIIGILLIGAESYMLHNAHFKRLEKNNKKLSSHQCYENLCVNDVNVIVNTKNPYVQFKIKNESNTVMKDGILEIIFDGELSKKFYCPKLKENQTAEIKIESDKEEVKQIKEYSIDISTNI